MVIMVKTPGFVEPAQKWRQKVEREEYGVVLLGIRIELTAWYSEGAPARRYGKPRIFRLSLSPLFRVVFIGYHCFGNVCLSPSMYWAWTVCLCPYLWGECGIMYGAVY